MTDYPLDIIIPVWNSPVEVRAALASFAADSPLARIVMVNNGSERETEAILHEFAEALDDRALLLSTGKNIGTVAALNLGLARSSAPFALVINPFVRMTAGWFDPVMSVFDRVIDAGAVCLRSGQAGAVEADHGSFTAMVLKRELFLNVAGFDEQLDGADWALRDFARKATACGFQTFSLGSRQLRCETQQEFGSQARREQRVSEARQLYIERWGLPGTYLLNCSDVLPGGSSDALREALLAAARQGDRLTVTAPGRTGRLLLQEGLSALHENITYLALPRFFPGRVLRRAVERIVSEDADARLIAEDAASPWPLSRLSFADFIASVKRRADRFYQGGVHV
jgi:hypothetical protein